MNRREFFGAGAGVALGTAGIGVVKEAVIPDNEWGPDQEWGLFLVRERRPELELGHSARWKIQRYPGAKCVPIHRNIENIQSVWEWSSELRRFVCLQNRFEEILPIISDCLSEQEVIDFVAERARQE